MRDSNHRSVTSNKPVIVITSTSYDRRALDVNSDRPLVSSLNHLTYQVCNSVKIRETIANDGAMDRIVSILRSCHFSLYELLDLPLRHVSNHKMAQDIWKKKKQALMGWKWLLGLQCLVLTGTRGPEDIRRKVFHAGIIPILATILDNYLLYHKNYDYMKGEPLSFDFKALDTEQMFHFLRVDKNETYEDYLEFVVGKDLFRLSDDDDFINEELLRDEKINPSDFGDVWSIFTSKDGENPFMDEDNAYYKSNFPIPREFYLGRIVPKLDDILWSLQLLAFLSKYSYTRRELQSSEFVERLSFRGMINRARSRLSGIYKGNIVGAHYTPSLLKEKSPSPELGFPDMYNFEGKNDIHESLSQPTTDKFLEELLDVKRKCAEISAKTDGENELLNRNPYEQLNIQISTNNSSDRHVQESQLIDNFNANWNYRDLCKDLDEDTWNHIQKKEPINLFPLVENFTPGNSNPKDVVYWSSVIMRNSCRKDEEKGVRQCANFACGKWEEYPKQFAKCRRCKSTKYCSRACQLKSWKFHRYWCNETKLASISRQLNYY